MIPYRLLLPPPNKLSTPTQLSTSATIHSYPTTKGAAIQRAKDLIIHPQITSAEPSNSFLRQISKTARSAQRGSAIQTSSFNRGLLRTQYILVVTERRLRARPLQYRTTLRSKWKGWDFGGMQLQPCSQTSLNYEYILEYIPFCAQAGLSGTKSLLTWFSLYELSLLYANLM